MSDEPERLQDMGDAASAHPGRLPRLRLRQWREEDLAPFAIVLGAFARSGGKIGRSLARVATLLRGRIALEVAGGDDRARRAGSGTEYVTIAALTTLEHFLVQKHSNQVRGKINHGHH